MKKIITILFILCATMETYCQAKEATPFLNFDFEDIEKGNPIGWSTFGNDYYTTGLDSINKKSGKYAASIELKSGPSNFKAWAFTIPNNYAGKKITLTGYIKTENVHEGYAGLWMRIDPSIAFDNMNKNGIKGTTDWTKYEITLTMNPEKTTQIVVGGILNGNGKMWMDDLKVSVDGKDIAELKPFERKIYPAEKDRAFDKGSQISSIKNDASTIKNLKSLGLIWGFLKYYHPNISKGNYNWDYELFRLLPKILKSENAEMVEQDLVKWIEDLGEFADGKEIYFNSSDVKFSPDLDWIKTFNFSKKLNSLLTKIKNAERSKEHYYVGLQPEVGNPKFKNEPSYSSMKYPDAGFRLLALYRYWNIIQYYFPYKNLIEEDWKSVLEEFLPKFILAKDEKEYTLATLELIGRIHDTHANIWGSNQVLNNYRGVRYAAVELTFIEDKAVITGYHNKKFGMESGLQIGDIITTINNLSIKEIVNDRLKYAPASNYPTKLRDIAPSLLRTNDSIIHVEFIRNDKTEKKILKTFSTKEINVYSKYHVSDTCFKLINKDIAYINNGSVKSKYLPTIWKEIQNTKGLIIDCRNYPSDFVIYNLSNYIMPQRKAFVKFTNASISSPGLFTFGKTLSTGKKNKNYYKGKVVILINEVSQSSAEFHSMAYKVHPNATVIGSTTAGADGNVSAFYLPGGISTMISGIGVYYPNGKETQRIGIVPDIEIKPTIKGIRNGEDELMKKAIEIIP